MYRMVTERFENLGSEKGYTTPPLSVIQQLVSEKVPSEISLTTER
jgi:hypothetical protein